MHILNYILNMCNIYQTYEQLVHIPKICLTNDFGYYRYIPHVYGNVTGTNISQKSFVRDILGI